MDLLDSKLKRLIPKDDEDKERERTCSGYRRELKSKREWMKQNIIERLASVDDGLVISVNLLQ